MTRPVAPAPRLILASASPRRRELLAQLGVPFEVVVADVTEHEEPSTDPRVMVAHNAALKADWATQPDPFRTPKREEYRDWIDAVEVATMWTGGFPEPLTFSLRAGVNNLLDKDPPIVSNGVAGPSIFGNGNTFPQVYDALGRLVFMNLTMKF